MTLYLLIEVQFSEQTFVRKNPAIANLQTVSGNAIKPPHNNKTDNKQNARKWE